MPTSPLQDIPKFTQTRILGFKICHLATLEWFDASCKVAKVFTICKIKKKLNSSNSKNVDVYGGDGM
jgi:hypothetical protein